LVYFNNTGGVLCLFTLLKKVLSEALVIAFDNVQARFRLDPDNQFKKVFLKND